MKLAKRFLSLALVVVMLMASCIVVSAAPSYSKKSSHTIKTGVTYTSYSVAGNTTQPMSVVTVTPDSGYVPMIYSGSNGGLMSVKQHYEAAVADGYEVLTAVNGSFFKMSQSISGTTYVYNSVIGINIVDGVLTCAHDATGNDAVVAFDANGTMKVLDTNLSFGLTHNGTAVSGGVAAINKKLKYIDYLSTHITSSNEAFINNGMNRIFYYDANSDDELAETKYACGYTGKSYTGWEVVCEVTSGSLSVGGTVTAKVVSAGYGKTYRQTKPSAKQFVLYGITGTAAAQSLSKMAKGDTVAINVKENVTVNAEAMSNVSSAFGYHGHIVKNGTDMTASLSSIGNNSVTTKARWTAVGIKADGTYVVATSDGGATGSAGLTMKEFAQTLKDMGCTNVIRFDGGYSTGMYLSNAGNGSAGYVMDPSREVADVLLIVKKSSIKDTDKTFGGGSSSTDDGNILAGKKYEAPKTTRGYTASLTDGEAALSCSPGSNNADWFALFQNSAAGADENCPTGIGEITFNLGESYKIDEIKVNIATDYAPEYIKAYVGGKEVGTLTGTSSAGSYWVSIKANGATGDSIKLEIKVKAGAYWAMFNEVKAYGEKFDGNILAGKDYEAPKTTRGYIASLTDGEAALSCTPGSNNAEWFALFQNSAAGADENCPTGIGEIIFKLDTTYAIDKITVNIATDYAPEYIKAYVGGKEVGTLTGTSSAGSYWISIDAKGAIGSEIKLEVKVKAGAYWAMFNEVKAYGSESTVVPPSNDHLRGDVNNDKVVDKKDYAAIKRFCFDTMTLEGDNLLAADVNNDGEVDKKDYAALKRYCFETWVIETPYI